MEDRNIAFWSSMMGWNMLVSWNRATPKNHLFSKFIWILSIINHPFLDITTYGTLHLGYGSTHLRRAKEPSVPEGAWALQSPETAPWPRKWPWLGKIEWSPWGFHMFHRENMVIWGKPGEMVMCWYSHSSLIWHVGLCSNVFWYPYIHQHSSEVAGFRCCNLDGYSPLDCSSFWGGTTSVENMFGQLPDFQPTRVYISRVNSI